ncbi:hypothetical protein RIF29_39994 [Crotalaria pallida]|uniref:Uncharacterized protein n=1 Tax=Crotalaria pallida TaxID=3830 RepID=A0AAN9HQ66_CROPI
MIQRQISLSLISLGIATRDAPIVILQFSKIKLFSNQCLGPDVAPDVFAIEEDYSRVRAHSQCGKSDLVQQAIETRFVDCIHWTSAAQLSLLEDEMRCVE